MQRAWGGSFLTRFRKSKEPNVAGAEQVLRTVVEDEGEGWEGLMSTAHVDPC